MPAPYAVNLHKIGGREKAVFAAELDSLCVGVWADTLEQEVLWEGKGGTMNTFQLNERGDFLAIQRVLPRISVQRRLYRKSGKPGGKMGTNGNRVSSLLPPDVRSGNRGRPSYGLLRFVRQ